jgi:hypothetical protein
VSGIGGTPVTTTADDDTVGVLDTDHVGVLVDDGVGDGAAVAGATDEATGVGLAKLPAPTMDQ